MACSIKSGSTTPRRARLGIIVAVVSLCACSMKQSAAGGSTGGFSASQQALYRQMDALREYSCKTLQANLSLADSRKRTEEMARQWLAIDQGVAAEREKDRATRDDIPNFSVALSSYWTQWQNALSSRQLCFDSNALASANLDGGFVRANGNGTWVVVKKTGDAAAPLPNNVLLTCSTPAKNPRSFERCAMDMVTTEAASK